MSNNPNEHIQMYISTTFNVPKESEDYISINSYYKKKGVVASKYTFNNIINILYTLI